MLQESSDACIHPIASIACFGAELLREVIPVVAQRPEFIRERSI